MTTSSRWQDAYRKYRRLEKVFTDDKSLHPLLTLLHSTTRGKRALQAELVGYKKVQAKRNDGVLPSPSDELIAKLSALAELQASHSPNSNDFMYDDVYHLAFDKLSSWRRYGEEILPADQCLRFYRGQRRDQWDVGAKIYRELPANEGRHEKLLPRTEAAMRLARLVADKRNISFKDAVAVCQHYSNEQILRDGTWLVDFSRDPWVGLFFASDGGETGDCGIVWEISRTEYSGRTAGSGNPIGQLLFVAPQGVPRIENQSGVFIEAGLSQIFDQYVAFGWDSRFRQCTGVVFEDPDMCIERSTIYPPDDEWLQFVTDITKALDVMEPAEARDDFAPATVFVAPYDPHTYQKLLEAWLDDRKRSGYETKQPNVHMHFSRLARFHALLQSNYANKLSSRTCRSLTRLRMAFESICFAETPTSADEVIKVNYISTALNTESDVQILREALAAAHAD